MFSKGNPNFLFFIFQISFSRIYLIF